jgi:hypothetical protein
MTRKRCLLVIGPVQFCRAKKKTGSIVNKAAVNLDITSEGRVERGSVGRYDPVDDCAFQGFGIIRTSTISAFLNLKCYVSIYYSERLNTCHGSDCNNLLVAGVKQPLMKRRYHLEKLLVHTNLPASSIG